ncbi:MAG: carboxypeptidase M32 [Rubricoccaceae bacterium]
MPLTALRSALADVMDLRHAAAVLEWDQETYMPPGAAEARAQQVATLRRIAHERFTSDELETLLDRAMPESRIGVDLVRVVRRDWRRATLLPARLVSEQAEASGRAKTAWKQAREKDDVAAFTPHLRQLVALAIEEADRVRPLIAEERGANYTPSEADARYDALLDTYEPGASTTDIARVFADLRRELVPLVAAIAEQPEPEDRFLHQHMAPEVQWAFGEAVAADLGYDFNHGRQDHSAHPFTTSFGITDVRITTRLDPDFFPTGFFGTVHEAGHGLYEQGIDRQLDRTPLADGTSLGMHESQSRLWENLVGRSDAFWQGRYADLQTHAPSLASVSRETFVRAINRVEPSLIRVEADELTYHLHVLLRVEIERQLIAGTLDAADVPEAWNAGMQDLLGITPPSNADGCLQDIHWSLGAFGYFPTYSLGTLMSVQLWNAAERDLGDLGPQLAAGTFAPLLEWLRTHIHRWGRTRTASDLLRDATGSDLDATPWLDYARTKYSALYEL